MSVPSPNRIRIFLSCPGDLAEEKAAVHQVALDANATWARRLNCRLSVWDWEREAQSRISGEDAQTELFRQVGIYEIYIGIMWGRFGAPTKHAGSGTVEEFAKALYLSRISQGDVPILKFFFKTAPLHLPTMAAFEQYRLVLKFRDDVQSKGLIETFDAPGDFKYQLCISLMRAVDEYVGRTADIATRPVFLYFLDHFFLDMVGARKNTRDRVIQEVTFASKLAYLLAGQVSVSASSFVESELCQAVIDKFAMLDLADRLPVLITGRGENLEAYKSKTVSHRKPRHASLYRRKDKSIEIPAHADFVPRSQSATAYILEHWVGNFSTGLYDSDIRHLAGLAGIEEQVLRERWAKLPSLMNNMDIIVPQVVPVLFGKSIRKRAIHGALHRIINKLYFDSIQSEFDYAILSDLPSIRAQVVPIATARLAFIKVRRFLQEAELLEPVSVCPFEELEQFRLGEQWQAALRRILLLFNQSP